MGCTSCKITKVGFIFQTVDTVTSNINHGKQGTYGSSNGFPYNNGNHEDCNGTNCSSRYDLVVCDDFEFTSRVLIKLVIIIIAFEQVTCYVNPFTVEFEITPYLQTSIFKYNIFEQNRIRHNSFYTQSSFV
jgi:hypothetical protein